MVSIFVRPAKPGDAVELCALLNAIIRIGGTTAHETPLDEAGFARHFITGPDIVCCFAAEDGQGGLAGFQALERSSRLSDGWGDIGTFARVEPKVPGVGTALFEVTKSRAAEAGLMMINATIRADNASGLAYYSKMGFVDYAVEKAVPLKDGTRIDHISKRYSLANHA